jgi:AraC family transcriptional regulator, transcriptional activator of pobA
MEDLLFIPNSFRHGFSIGANGFAGRFVEAECDQHSCVHRHKFFEVHWLVRGEATFFCDFEQYELQSGSLVFIAPGQVHTWLSDFTKIDLIVIGFKPELFALSGDNLRQRVTGLPFYDMTAPPFVQIETERKSIMDNLFFTALERQRTSSQNDSLLMAYLNVIFAEAQIAYENAPVQTSLNAATRLAKEFRIAVEYHYQARKQVQEYAQMLGVTANHLVETVRQTTGITPGQFLGERLLLEAKRLLIYTNDTISEIAYELSFENPSQFGRWFKSLEGVTPGQFRQQFIIPYF